MKLHEIDALVAEKVMGYEIRYGNIVRDGKRSGIPPYSQKIEHAWKVVDKMKILISPQSEGAPKECKYMAEYADMPWEDSIQVFNESAPLAICLAALKSVGVEVEE